MTGSVSSAHVPPPLLFTGALEHWVAVGLAEPAPRGSMPGTLLPPALLRLSDVVRLQLHNELAKLQVCVFHV